MFGDFGMDLEMKTFFWKPPISFGRVRCHDTGRSWTGNDKGQVARGMRPSAILAIATALLEFQALELGRFDKKASGHYIYIILYLSIYLSIHPSLYLSIYNRFHRFLGGSKTHWEKWSTHLSLTVSWICGRPGLSQHVFWSKFKTYCTIGFWRSTQIWNLQ